MEGKRMKGSILLGAYKLLNTMLGKEVETPCCMW